MKTAFFDVDTQLDFVYPSGALYVPGAGPILPAVSRLNRHAAAHGIPLISTMDAHAEDDIEFRTWPHHCVASSLGQRKAEADCWLTDGVVLPNRPGPVAISGDRQIVIEKQSVKVFDSDTLSPVLDHVGSRPVRALRRGNQEILPSSGPPALSSAYAASAST